MSFVPKQTSRHTLYQVLEAGYSTSVAYTPSNFLPPARTDDEERFFYLLHRPSDSPSASPNAALRIVRSGGVGANRSRENIHSAGENVIAPAVRNVIAPAVRNVIAHDLDEEQRIKIMTSRLRSSVSWFYMNSWQGQDVRTLASNEELVFRVPNTWLAQNALSCVEYTVNGKELSRDGKSFRAWAFLTPLVVPLAFRIVDSTPLKNEDARKMSNAEVASVLYMAHSAADSSSRDERVYNVTPAAEPPSEDGAPHINPF